jgi:hypothetical protein
VAITRITPWAVTGPTTSYGLASSLSGTATNVPAGALIVTSVQSQSTTQPSVSDTAGNTYTVVKGGSDTSHLTTWVAYCLSAIANSANVVTWSATSAVLTGAQGEAATTSSGTWAFDKVVGGYSAYATALSLSISTTGVGLIYGGFGEYEIGPDVWTVTGLTAQASQPGSSTGTGNCGCLLADDITSGAVSGLSISVTDQNGTYGGYIVGVVGSFVVSSGSSDTAIAAATTQPVAAGTAQALNSAFATGFTTPLAAAVAQALNSAQATGVTSPPRAAGTANSIAYAIAAATTVPTAAGSAQGYASALAAARTVPLASGTAEQILPYNTAFATGVSPAPTAAATAQSVNYAFAAAATLQPRASGEVFIFDPNFYVAQPADFETADPLAFYVQAPAQSFLT